MKIAVLILIHKYTEQQKKLISTLSKNFDLFVHIDRKTNIREEDISSDRVHAYKRYKVYWGSFEFIAATLFLLRKSSEIGYDRYIIISGEDCPIKSNSQISAFFENNDKEYFYGEKMPRSVWNGNGGFDRLDYFHPNAIRRSADASWAYISYKMLDTANRKLFVPAMKMLNIKRRMKIQYWGGHNWMDLTDACVRKLLDFLDSNPWYYRKYRLTRCGDEIFFHTAIRNYCPGLNIENRCLRYVDWESGPQYPRIFRLEDFGRIAASDCLFARKFDQSLDGEIIDRIYDMTAPV